MSESILSAAYIVSGQPHILLGHEQNEGWNSLYQSYAEVRKDIEAQNADLILYFSTQWLSVIGYMFQGDPAPEWVHVDHNFHDLGSMPYKFKVDTEFAESYAKEVNDLGFTTKVVNYRGFPIDTGTIVAQKLLNPDNKLPAAMVSCGLYAEKEETTQLGQAAAWALKKTNKKVIAVLVSNLSNRFEIKKIDPKHDNISSLKDDEWNRKILEILERGALEDASQVAREFAKQANGDMGFKGIWWLNGLCGESNDFHGKVFDYQPVWGTGAALVGLKPKYSIQPKAYDYFQSEEGSQAELVKGIADRHGTGSTPKENVSVTLENVRISANPLDSKSTNQEIFQSNRSPEPVGAYPHARKVGDLLFLSGMGPRVRGSKEIPGVELDTEGNIIAYDIEIQTRSVFNNLKMVLEDAGSSMDKIIDIQVFLTNMKADFKIYNGIYAEFFNAETGPTRTTIEISSLPTPIAIELKVIALP